MKYDPEEDTNPRERIRTQPCQRREGIKNKRAATKKIKAKKRAYRQHTVSFFQSHLWTQLKQLVKRTYGHRCMRCGHTGSAENRLSVDHIRPRARAMESETLFANLQVLCEACNTWKGRNTIDYRPQPLPPEATRLIVLQQMHSIEQIIALTHVAPFGKGRAKIRTNQ